MDPAVEADRIYGARAAIADVLVVADIARLACDYYGDLWTVHCSGCGAALNRDDPAGIETTVALDGMTNGTYCIDMEMTNW